MASTPETFGSSQGVVRKEGWLFKRGEHIKNWRARYFVLRDDGTLMGYKARPDGITPADAINNFTVRDCQIMAMDRPKPFTFAIRGLQLTTVIERTFHVESETERQEWIDAIGYVANKLNVSDMSNVDMASIAEVELSEKFAVQGTSTGKNSGQRKIVINFFIRNCKS